MLQYRETDRVIRLAGKTDCSYQICYGQDNISLLWPFDQITLKEGLVKLRQQVRHFTVNILAT